MTVPAAVENVEHQPDATMGIGKITAAVCAGRRLGPELTSGIPDQASLHHENVALGDT